MRAFTAIPIPRKHSQKLAKIQEELGAGKPVRPEKMHITFEFFEELDQDEARTIRNHLEEIKLEAFDIRIKGIGAFPSRKHIRVLWAGIESDRIGEAYRKASNHSIESDNDHEFKPHITLSRVKNLKKGEKKHIHQKMKDYRGREIGSFEASKIVFYKSEMTSSGSEYSKLYVKNL
jgi:2'-5' RNA ligase